MARSPDSLVPSDDGQLPAEKRDDKAFTCRQGGEANPRAATTVNAVSASSTRPTRMPTQLELFPWRASPLVAKPDTDRSAASAAPDRRDGVQGGGTRRERTRITGETLFGPEETLASVSGREAYKGEPRKRGNDAGQGVGGGCSTDEPRENRGEERAAASTTCLKQGKAVGLPPRGKAITRRSSGKGRKLPVRMAKARKLQRALYRVAKSQPGRRFASLYDKVCRQDILAEAWQRVRANRGAAGVDDQSIQDVEAYGVEKFLSEIGAELTHEAYRANWVRRAYIPKPDQPGRTRPLGIPTVKDRVIQMAVKLVIEPLFEVDFLPCSFGFRPRITARMALTAICEAVQAGCLHVVDVDLRSYFDTIDHRLLLKLVGRRVGDKRVLRLIRAWLQAGVMEEGNVRHPVRGSPQGGVISPLLANIFLHEVDRQWSNAAGERLYGQPVLIRYADDMVLLARSAELAQEAWKRLQEQVAGLGLEINQEKSQVTTLSQGFAFLGFEFRQTPRRPLYVWPRAKAVKHLGNKVRKTVRTFPSTAEIGEVIGKLNPVLWGWCTYFRVGNSNRTFHEVDWMVRSELQLWLRRKHRCTWGHAQRQWPYQYLHGRCRLYRMVGKVSHLPGLRRTSPAEGGRRAVCGKPARTVR